MRSPPHSSPAGTAQRSSKGAAPDGIAPAGNGLTEMHGLRKDGSQIPHGGIDPARAQSEGGNGQSLPLGFFTDITERALSQSGSRRRSPASTCIDNGITTRAASVTSFDLASIFQVVVRSLEDSLPIDFGCVCLYDKSHKLLTVTCVGVNS